MLTTLRTILVCNVVVLLLSTTPACHRSFYRRQADADATRLIEEKSLDPHWSIPGYTIEVDPGSRMFDPFSQDHPPMPPDDPSAAELMREVDGKPGFPHWHANGDTPYVENPEWRYMLPVDEDGKLVVDIDTAVDLALKHSPVYQRELEDLYLSALRVSLERFDFETQFFAPFNSTFTTNGGLRGGGSTLNNNNGVGARLSKAGITGSRLLVGFANSIIWQYSGTDSQIGFGSLSAELIQPLLRRAGRDVILEALTDAERELLYNVRQLERFRRGYVQEITAGFNSGGGVNIGAVFGNVGFVSLNAGGVLGLLQTQQNLRIRDDNIASQRTLLEQFKEYYDFQRIDLLQLKQFKNSVYSTQSNQLLNQVNYQNSLDDFKITLGLPPDLDIEIKDPILDQFILIGDDINARKAEVGELRKTASDVFLDISDVTSRSLNAIKAAQEDMINNGWFVFRYPELDTSWKELDVDFELAVEDDPSLREQVNLVRDTLRKIEPIYQKVIEEDFQKTQKDIDTLRNSLGRRRSRLTELYQRYFENEDADAEEPVIESEVLDVTTLDTLVNDRLIEFNGGMRKNQQGRLERVTGVKTNVRNGLERLVSLLRTWEVILANGGKLPQEELDREPLRSLLGPNGDDSLKEAIQTRAGTIRRFISEPGPEVLTEISNLIIDVSLIQALARVDTLTLPVVKISWQEALELAREHRRDWMNARAQLVDQWRNIEIVADDLESQLDLTFAGDMQNTGDNPLKLRSKNGQLRIGLQFDAPITRLAERNNYRAALIEYQRTKRAFYQFEDNIAAQLRQIIRQLEVVKLNFEISRNQFKNSVDEVQLASYDLVRPPRPGSGNTQVGFQVARNLINALFNLLNNQNDLIRNWVSYESLRRQLDFNMGTMQLDENGYWIDPIEITAESVRNAMSGEFIPGMSPLNDEGGNNGVDGNTAPMEIPNQPMGSRPNGNQFSNYSRSNGNQFGPNQVSANQVRTDGRSLENKNPNFQSKAFLVSNRDSAPGSGTAFSARQFDTNRQEDNSRSQESFLSNRTGSIPKRTAQQFEESNPPSRVSASSKPFRRLYSNFDSDLRRAKTSSLNTSIKRPTSTLNRLPAGKKIVDRKVNRVDYREALPTVPDPQSPRIDPFPFKLD